MQEQARALDEQASALWRSGDRAEAIELWEKAIPLFEADAAEHGRIANRLCVAYREAGRWDRARTAGRTAVARAREIGDARLELMASVHLGDVHLARGEHADARICFERADALTKTVNIPGAVGGVARRRAEVALFGEDDAALLRLAREAVQAALEDGQVFDAARAQALQAVGLARRGRTAEVGPLLEQALETARKHNAASEVAEIRRVAAHAWLAAGRLADALDQATRAAVYAEEVGNVRLRAQADALIARAKGALADGDDRTMDRLLDLSAAVARIRDLELLLDAIGDAAMDLLHGDRAFVVLSEGGDLRVAASRARDRAEPGEPSMSIVKKAIGERREVVATDLDDRSDLKEAASVAAMGLLSVLCVPLVDGRDVLGAIYVDSQRVSTQQFTEALRYARALAGSAAVAVTNARHLESARRRGEEAAAFADEVRGPLTTILTLAEFLRDAKADPVWLEEICDGIGERGRQVMAVAEHFLSSRRETWAPVDLAVLTRELVDLMAWDSRRKGVVIDHDADEGAWVRGDADGLASALTGLLAAAIRRTPAGGRAQLRIVVDADEVVWELRDGGPNIRPDDLDPARKGPLAWDMARRTAEAHGGRLGAIAPDAGGAGVRVVLPQAIGVTTG